VFYRVRLPQKALVSRAVDSSPDTFNDVVRFVVRTALRREGKSVAEMGRQLGIEQGPAHRRVNGRTYAWRIVDLWTIGTWLGVDLINETTTMWKAVMAGEAELGTIRVGTGGSSLGAERGPARQGRRSSPAA
jgi:hypothetical protein